ALLAPAADEGVLERTVDRLLREAVQLALVGVVALGKRQQLRALGPAYGSTFDSRHSSSPAETGRWHPPTSFGPFRTMRPFLPRAPRAPAGGGAGRQPASAYRYGSMCSSLAWSCAATTVIPRRPRFRLVVLLVRMCRLNALLRMNFPEAVRLNRFAAPLCVFSFGMISLRLVRAPSSCAAYALSTSGEGSGVRAAAFSAAAFLMPGRAVRIVCIWLPSRRGSDSARAMSFSSPINRSRMRRPISGCAISRP